MNKDFLHPFRKYRRGGRLLRGIGKGTRRAIRAGRPSQHRRGCCCPGFLVLGLVGLGTIAGLFYAGMRFLGWA
jgi:hypothetical protein